MLAVKPLASAVAPAVGTAFWIQLMTAGAEVTAGGRLQPPRGRTLNNINYQYEGRLIYHHRGQVNASPVDQRTGFHTPASRDQEFSPATVHDGGFDTSLDPLPESTGLKSLQRSYTSDQNGPEHQQLSPNEMIAPASAVHSMSVNLLGSNDVSDVFPKIMRLYILTLVRYLWTPRAKVIPEAMSLIEGSLARSSLA
jgi:hypothetical protein